MNLKSYAKTSNFLKTYDEDDYIDDFNELRPLRYFLMTSDLIWFIVFLLFCISQHKKLSLIVMAIFVLFLLYLLFSCIINGLECEKDLSYKFGYNNNYYYDNIRDHKRKRNFNIFIHVVCFISGVFSYYYSLALIINEGLGRNLLPTFENER